VATTPTKYGSLRDRVSVALIITLLLPLLALAAVPAGAEEGDAVIHGVVRAEGGAPVEGACVGGYLTQYGAPAAWTQTAPDGAFELRSASGGTFRLQIQDCRSGGLVAQWYDGQSTFEAATPVTVASGQVLEGIEVVLLPGGAIEGTVRTDTGAPLAGICVSASSVGSGLGAGAQSGDDGHYSIRGLGSGDHRVSFNDCRSEPTRVGQYYDAKAQWSEADLVTVVGTETVTGIDASLALGGVLSGTVRDTSGNGIGRQCVQVSGSAGVVAFAMTYDGERAGEYRTPPVLPGVYRVEFVGFCDSDYLPQWYDGKSSAETASQVTITAGATTDGIDATLVRGGSISGRVVDPDGSGIGGACVMAGTTQTFHRSATTAPDGTYSLRGLPDGSYSVQFRGCGDGSWVGEWYDDQPSAPTPVVVTNRGDVTGIDAELAPGGQVAGRVTSEGGQPLADVCVGSGGLAHASTGTDGTYVLRGVPAGANVISFTFCGSEGAGYLQEYYDDQAAFDDATSVDVVVGETTTGIDAALAPGGAIAGRVLDGQGLPAVDACVHAVTGGSGRLAGVSPQGTYVLRGLPAGPIKVGFSMPCFAEPTSWWEGRSSAAEADDVVVVLGETVTGIDGVVGQSTSIHTPTAILTATPASGAVPLTTTLSFEAADNEGGTLAYQVDFGDGSSRSTGELQEPYEVVDLEHTYESPGAFTARVTLRDGEGNVGRADTVVRVGELPSAPAYVQATPGDQQVELLWPAPYEGSSPLEAYVMATEQLTASGWDQVRVDETEPHETTATVTGLQNGETYRFAVSARNASGEGPSGTSPSVIPKGATRTTIAPAQLELVYGEPGVLTATVESTGTDPATPSGAVSFRNGDSLLHTTSLTGAGVATANTFGWAVGAYDVSASYAGSVRFEPSTSTENSSVTVTRAASTVTVSSNPNPAFEGDNVEIVVNVQGSAPSQAAGAGSVQLRIDGAAAGTSTLNNGTARFARSDLSAGTHLVEAVYAGDSNMEGSTGSTSLVIAGPAATEVDLTAPEYVIEGDTADLVARVTNQTYAFTPTGEIVWRNGSTVIGTTSLVGGEARLTTGALPFGDHHITASYSGERRFLPSSATETIIASRRPEPGGSDPAKAPSSSGGLGGTPGGGGGDGGSTFFPGGTGTGPFTGGDAANPISWRRIKSSGPLTDIWVSTELNCNVRHTGDREEAYYADACGTFAVVGGVLYGPRYLRTPNPPTSTPYTAVSQTDVTGSGTSTDPYEIVTEVALGESDVRLVQTDSYVVGQSSYITSVEVANDGPQTREIRVYRAGDCFVSDWDSGYGRYDGPDASIGCRESLYPDDAPGERVLEVGLIGGGGSVQAGMYDDVWRSVSAKQTLPDAVLCELSDNAHAVEASVGVAEADHEWVEFSTAFRTRVQGCGDRPPSKIPPRIQLRAMPNLIYIGERVDVTVALHDDNGDPRQGEQVRLSVLSGPSTNHYAALLTTDDLGTVRSGYRNWDEGVDRVRAWVDIDGDGQLGPADDVAEAQVRWSSVASHAPPPLGPGEPYVALGDSYSSGEGLNRHYDPSTAWSRFRIPLTDERVGNECHRSRMAYPERALLNGGLTRTFAACSGALIDDFYHRRGFKQRPGEDGDLYSPEEKPQVQWLGTNTRYVTMTFSGNDALFEDILTACNFSRRAFKGQPSDEFKRGCDEKIQESYDKLDEIERQLQAMYHLATERARNARIGVLNYPRLFPDVGTYTTPRTAPANTCEVSGAGYYVLNEHVERFTHLTWSLNRRIAAAVSSVNRRLDRRPVELVDVESHFGDHTISCGDDSRPRPWINAGRAEFGPNPSKATFHPNEKGQCEMAKKVNEHFGWTRDTPTCK